MLPIRRSQLGKELEVMRGTGFPWTLTVYWYKEPARTVVTGVLRIFGAGGLWRESETVCDAAGDTPLFAVTVKSTEPVPWGTVPVISQQPLNCNQGGSCVVVINGVGDPRATTWYWNVVPDTAVAGGELMIKGALAVLPPLLTVVGALVGGGVGTEMMVMLNV